MTRILFWNIRDFAINKINDPSMDRQPGSTLPRTVSSAQRQIHIATVIRTVNPDIFILVENETAWTGRGALVSGAGSVAGPINLLAIIRAATGNPNWMLIPPLQTGSREAVAVFYNRLAVSFSGPNTWSGGAGGISQLPAVAAGAAYPGNFAAGLPAAGVTVPGGLYNVGADQNVLAARVEFNYAAHMGMLAGGAYAYGATRAPYMTTFYDAAAARNISIFSIHSPANIVAAQNYLTDLTELAEIADGIAADEVRVVAGDFNVNLLGGAPGYALNAFYNIPGYTLELTPPAAAPAPPLGYLGYFSTHIKPTYDVDYGTTVAQTQYFPGYGYIGSLIGNFYAIDNIFTRYGGAGAGGPAGNFTVMNTVSSSPFNALGYAAPIAGTPVGNLAMPTEMTMFLGINPPPPAIVPAYNIGSQSRFRGWENYGRIYSVSDHFALAIDV